MKSKKVHCIVQCRLSSRRLPSKIFFPGPTKPLIGHLIERLNYSKKINKVIIATTKNKKDSYIFNYFKKRNIHVFRGDELNVLERYYMCAKKFNSDIIVRVTSDCPLMDYRVIDQMLNYYKKNNCDYLSNVHPPSFPKGFDIEIFNFKCLKTAYKNAKKNFEKEHVTTYIWKNPNKFFIKNFPKNKTKKNLYNSHRLTLDFLEDYLLILKIYNKFYFKDKKFSLLKILTYIKKNPKDLKINKNLKYY